MTSLQYVGNILGVIMNNFLFENRHLYVLSARG